MDREQVDESLAFAERRLAELVSLNGGELPGASPDERQLLIKEFFFHLTASVDYLAQAINQKLYLGIDPQDVSVGEVANSIPAPQVSSALRDLHPSTRHKPIPSDPYGDEGLIFRAFVYRNQVAHTRRNPFPSGSPLEKRTCIWILGNQTATPQPRLVSANLNR
jgi:hypothetical protein